MAKSSRKPCFGPKNAAKKRLHGLGMLLDYSTGFRK
jgi:hypothetical protein